MRHLDTSPAAAPIPWWQDWPGYSLTLFFAAVAAVVVVWQLIRYYKDAPAVEWRITAAGSSSGFRAVEITNTGDATAIQTGCHTSFGSTLNQAYTVPPRIEPGIPFRVGVNVDRDGIDINDAVLYLTYISTPTRRRKHRSLVVKVASATSNIESSR